jgi:hypothetical protein
VTEAVLLVHARTDAAWFHEAAGGAAAVCFTRGRIRFATPTGRGTARPRARRSSTSATVPRGSRGSSATPASCSSTGSLRFAPCRRRRPSAPGRPCTRGRWRHADDRRSRPRGVARTAVLEALARHYGPAEFSARGAAAAIPGTLWQAAGVARPRPRGGRQVATGPQGRRRRPRPGQPEEPRRRRPVAAAAGRAAQADVPTETSRASPTPASLRPGESQLRRPRFRTSARLPEPSAPPLASPWWARSSFRPVPAAGAGRGTPARGHVVVARRGAP